MTVFQCFLWVRSLEITKIDSYHMRLMCLSDIHGELRPYDLHDAADVAVIAGDVTPADRRYYGGVPSGLLQQEQWFRDRFLPWVQSLPVKHVVMTWGNHDHLGEHPNLYRAMLPPNVHVLVNESCVIDGVRFYGVPQTPRFYDWAFNVDDTPEGLGRVWSQVDDHTDILLSHGPPFGVVDWVDSRQGARVGSLTQSVWLKSESNNVPRLVICGHLHAAGGHEGYCGNVRVVNVSIVNDAYDVVREPTYLALPELPAARR